jgi:hypothetical protein
MQDNLAMMEIISLEWSHFYCHVSPGLDIIMLPEMADDQMTSEAEQELPND